MVKPRHVFNKYDLKQDYHWKGYLKGGNYTKSVNKTVDIIQNYYRDKNIAKPKLLDIGCGDGVFTWLLDAYGIDSCPKAIELAKVRQVKCQLLSALQIRDLENQSWDGICMFDYFEHEENQLHLLRLIGQMTKIIHLLNPFPCNSAHHTTEFTSIGLINFMKEYGWKCYLHFSEPLFFRDMKDFFIFEKI